MRTSVLFACKQETGLDCLITTVNSPVGHTVGLFAAGSRVIKSEEQLFQNGHIWDHWMRLPRTLNCSSFGPEVSRGAAAQTAGKSRVHQQAGTGSSSVLWESRVRSLLWPIRGLGWRSASGRSVRLTFTCSCCVSLSVEGRRNMSRGSKRTSDLCVCLCVCV